ncbi:iqgap- protein [Tilletia horrida]|uniref:Iqgap- protein n=1 Tax=Tilletia horrida TaxID=155126 RepID=A0AAN6GCB2_9BASI|nr:iqgap- protein [Tilletia horrida]
MDPSSSRPAAGAGGTNGSSSSSGSALPAASPSSRNPFAYQAKYLERSASRSTASSFSLASAGSIPPSATSGLNSLASTADGAGPPRTSVLPSAGGGMARSGSVRKYPMPHRHTASLDPSRTAEVRSGSLRNGQTSGAGSPSTPQGSFVPLPATSPSSSATNSPLAARMANFTTTPTNASTSSSSGRPISMPPAPRDPSILGSGKRSASPTKGMFESYSPSARPTSPTKGYVHQTPGSPTKKDDSWINSSSPRAAQGSFWSSSSPAPAAPPSAVHLGGVSDLKRSSVGALKMMRQYTARSDSVPAAGVPDAGHTLLTVGRKNSTRIAPGANGAIQEDSGWEKPARPGRMESEDQAGEIVLPGITTGAEDVTGLQGRIRLARQGPAPTQLGASSSLPYSTNSRWMDTQRHLLQAYEYLCHCGEAKEWMEHCVGEELGAIVDMENEMRDGVFLAKLARKFEPECVPRIFVNPKLQYRHTDNTNYFFTFVNKVGLPVFFQFELTDLYEKKNFPKVVYCIHALSHLLARQGRALKVGNLLGKLEFTDDQLQQTQRGLDAAGVAMPSFGGVGKALAKEMNVEPEPEPETEQERIDRELFENIDAVLALQTACRGFLGRMRRDRLAEEAEIRRQIEEEARRRREEEERKRLEEEQRLLEEERKRKEEERRRREEEQRRRREEEERKRREEEERRRIEEEERKRREEEERRRKEEERLRLLEEQRLAEEARQKAEDERIIAAWAPKLQAGIRGFLARQSHNDKLYTLQRHASSITDLQAQARGALARRRYEDLIFRLAESTEDVIKIQSACRAVLARRALLNKIRAMRATTDCTVMVQAQIRGVLARKNYRAMSAALQQVEVVRSVNGLQSFARAALARKKHQEQRKQLEFVAPDVVGLQAQIRGAMVRREYIMWRDHLRSSEAVVVHLQSLIRGVLQRRKYQAKMRHYNEHMDKVVKIQSLFRGKQQGEQYRSLTVGKNVPVATIKNFGHLLNDSDHDFEDEIEVERLRKLVVRNIRENQTLEVDVTELDTKIALLVKNKLGIEELIKAKNERGLLRQREAAAAIQRRNSLLVAAGDPFAEQNLDRTARRKLELYQELFHTLQTRPEYLARLFVRVGRVDMSDKQKKQIEKIVLTLFGYAQNSREEYLLLKLFQQCVVEELAGVATVQEFIRGNAQFIKLVVQYNRGAKERKYLRDLLSPLVRGVMDDDTIDLETDPCAIYQTTINMEEMQTGMPSRRPLDVNFHEALADPTARLIFIRHLQALRGTTEAFLAAMIGSTKRMPYGIRYIAREVFRALQAKFPNEPETALIKVVGHLVYYRYLNPAIVAPEGFDVVETLVGPVQRKNLAEISKMLTQIAVGKLFSEDNPYLQPLNEYVSQASQRFTKWLFSVVDVQDAEMQFSASEFLDHAANQRPVIYISPNEIYSMHNLVLSQIDHLAPHHDDALRAVLSELGAAPVSNTQELNTARDSEITLELKSNVRTLKDPEAETKALFVETKRLVLSILKVQTGKTLLDVFLAPVSPQDEMTWEEIVSLEVAADRQRNRGQRPPAPPQLGPKLEDVRRLTFPELKARTLENMLRLEKLGKVSRANNYQDMLNAIAVDIRNKHRKRVQRHNEKAAMLTTLDNLAEKKAYLEEQISSYHSYIDASMQTMQKKGRKKFVLPFSQQYFHLRSLKATGKVPQFGSYKYTAKVLHEKGVLISIDQFSQKQFDQITLTISSDEAGLFTIEASVLGVSGGSCDIRIEDLLEAQFNNIQHISLMDGMAKCHVNMLIALINRKFYA